MFQLLLFLCENNNMKIPRFALVALAKWTDKAIQKRRKGYPPHGLYEEYLNVPYIDDDCLFHKYDVYKAKDRSKKCCIIDVHGGSYMFSNHEDNYPFGLVFLEKGFDFMTPDYVPADGKRETLDLVRDCVNCINHFVDHIKDYGLEDDCFFITGDSAGGHFALLLAELMTNKEIQEKLDLNLPDIDLRGVLLNCPVYDFEYTGYGMLTKGAMKRMFGKNYSLEKMRMVSPKTYIDSFKLPLFLSTCKYDFIRHESLKLNEDMSKKDNIYKYVNLNIDKKEVNHVHNVVYLKMEESIYVNNQMIDFIDEILKK